MGIEEQFILLAIGWVFIFVRIFVRTRQVGITGWQLDDYLMPLAGVSFLTQFVSILFHLVQVLLRSIGGERTDLAFSARRPFSR